MAKNKILFDVVGKTDDGKLVISGVMKFRESYGLPLVYIFDIIKNNNMVISWYHLIDEANIIGVNFDKFLSELKSAIIDVFGIEYFNLIWGKINERV